MHADGYWLAVEGALSKDMATLRKYLQTWKLKVNTTITVSTAFHLNNKEAKRELKVNFNNENLPFCSEPKYLGVTLDRSLTYRRHLESLRKKTTSCRAPEAACWLWLRCWSNNAANSHPSPGPFDCRVLRSCLVPQCSYPPYWSHHQRRLANCDWMPASYSSGQLSNPRRHPTWWASSQRSHTISSTPCHGAWTPAPLSAHPSIGCNARRLKSRHPFVPAAKHLISFLTTTTYVRRSGRIINGTRSGRTTPQNSALQFQTPMHTHLEWPSQEGPGSGSTASAPVSDVSAPACTMGFSLLWGLWVWRRTNRRPCRPPLSNPSIPQRTTRPDGSGRWDNRIAAQHLPRYPGGLAEAKRRTRSNERRRRSSFSKIFDSRSGSGKKRRIVPCLLQHSGFAV